MQDIPVRSEGTTCEFIILAETGFGCYKRYEQGRMSMLVFQI